LIRGNHESRQITQASLRNSSTLGIDFFYILRLFSIS
jgi:hypothetical protein